MTHPFVPRIVEFGDTHVKANAKCKCPCKDGGNEYAYHGQDGEQERDVKKQVAYYCA